jgi:hypothetical protein
LDEIVEDAAALLQHEKGETIPARPFSGSFLMANLSTDNAQR